MASNHANGCELVGPGTSWPEALSAGPGDVVTVSRPVGGELARTKS
jgi:hypothetical protein